MGFVGGIEYPREVVSDDDSTQYRVTRRAAGRSATLRDVVTDPIEDPDERKTCRELPILLPDGSQTNVRRVARHEVPVVDDDEPTPPIPVLPSLAAAHRRSATILRDRFGGVDIVVEHRGDEVTVVLPGSLRLIGTRAEAMRLIGLLLGQS